MRRTPIRPFKHFVRAVVRTAKATPELVAIAARSLSQAVNHSYHIARLEIAIEVSRSRHASATSPTHSAAPPPPAGTTDSSPAPIPISPVRTLATPPFGVVNIWMPDGAPPRGGLASAMLRLRVESPN
jgi:hypothetical protein